MHYLICGNSYLTKWEFLMSDLKSLTALQAVINIVCFFITSIDGEAVRLVTGWGLLLSAAYLILWLMEPLNREYLRLRWFILDQMEYVWEEGQDPMTLLHQLPWF